MKKTSEFVCVGCPIGCPLQLEHENDQIVEISGNECNRGAKYARQEFTDPRRAMSTTVAIRGAVWARLPVKVSEAIPKDRVVEASKIIHSIQVDAPAVCGQVLLSDLLGEKGINVVATRSMERTG